MTDEDALLAAICANPADDTARLAYADWLDEHNQAARAEFIRVQVELARIPACDRSHFDNEFSGGMCVKCQSHPLRVRERELLQTHGDNWANFAVGVDMLGVRWLGFARATGNPDRRHCTQFDRGFVGRLRLSGDDWAEHGDDLVKRVPLTRVEFTEGAPDASEIRRRNGKYESFFAGKWVEADPPGMMEIPGAPLPELLRRAEHNRRLRLSARWPTIPPEGWVFPEPVERIDNFNRADGATGPFDGGIVWENNEILTPAFTGRWQRDEMSNEMRRRLATDAYLRDLLNFAADDWMRRADCRDHRRRFLDRPQHGRPIHQLDHRCDGDPRTASDQFRNTRIDCGQEVLRWDHPERVGNEARFYAGRCSRCRTVFITEPEVREGVDPNAQLAPAAH